MFTDSPGPTRRRGPSSRIRRSPSTAATRTHSVPSEKKASTGVRTLIRWLSRTSE